MNSEPQAEATDVRTFEAILDRQRSNLKVVESAEARIARVLSRLRGAEPQSTESNGDKPSDNLINQFNTVTVDTRCGLDSISNLLDELEQFI